MKKRTKRVVGMTALVAGAVGAFLWKRIKMNGDAKRQREEKSAASVWARPGMSVTFRAELMPGRDASERVFRVKELLPSGRVTLQGFAGEHTEKEFERIR